MLNDDESQVERRPLNRTIAKIDKLAILGVRSFDNRRSETIQFHSPLTLIVGLNGAGKTTIIECLKFATTGELPSNSKTGGSWIHDPKLCSENEVLAQVKLSFISTAGARMVATRNLQLTVRKNSRSQKTLEGQLLMVKNGERTSISSRVAELDALMPQYLGVSRAILESVIFVHQEDSLWPMSEPAQLKKRFDEIFEALKYTKAIENIKLLRKKQGDELAKLKLVEQHAKDDKEKGDRAEKRSTELFDEIEAIRKQVQDLGNKIKDATEKSREAWDQSAKYAKTVGDLQGKRIEARAKEQTVQELRSSMKEMSESDEELQSLIGSYEERMELHGQQMGVKRKRYDELAGDLQHTRSALGAKRNEEGRYQAQKDQYEQDREIREQLIQETARRHNIRGYELEISEAQVLEFSERLSKVARDQNAALERIRKEKAEELITAQSALSQLNGRRSALNQEKDSTRQQIGSNDRKLDGYQAQLDDIEIDEGGKIVLESNVADADRRSKEAKHDLEQSNLDHVLRSLGEHERSLDESKARLDAELIQATRDAASSARLDHLYKESKDRQQSLDTVVHTHAKRIKDVLGQQWEIDTLDSKFQAALAQRLDLLKDAEQQRDGSSRDLEHVNYKLSNTRADLKKRREQCETHEKKVRNAIEDEPSEYPEIVKDLERSREVCITDNTSFQNMADYYNKAKELLDDHDMCLLCRRSLRTEKERSNFQTVLQKHLAKAVDEACKEQLEATEADLNEARSVQVDYDSWVRLKSSEIPALDKAVKDLENRHAIVLIEVERHDKAVKERQEAKRELEFYSKTVQMILKYSSEVSSLKSQIDELSERRRNAGMSRSLEEIQVDLKTNNEQMKSAKDLILQTTSKRERIRSEVNRLEIELLDLQGKLNTAVYQLKEKSNLANQVQELRAQNSEHREHINILDTEIQSINTQIVETQAKCDEINSRGEDKIRELQTDASKLNNSLNQLKMSNQGINSYLDRGGDQQLSRAKREIQNLKEEVENVENEQLQIVREIKKFEDQLRNHDETRRAISDNLRFRHNVRALDALRREIQEVSSSNAEADKDHYEREGSKWQLERNKLSAEQASLIGSLKSKDDQLQQLIQDWETDYKDAAYKYKEAHIKVETTRAAVEDLGRYGGALDKAIMKYHSLKMEEINRIIEELWKKTYQGTDVDTILIRADNETKSTTNRSYNYRVCMVKQDAEMDMRGRCSAGQKVLACIIIRLALAECFGVNCGLIALDEPTTNLDRDNIRALAQSLHDIIRVRRQQSNFQLIVITHDEEFLRYMHCADFCDVYYRVSRNDRQKSMIERQSIAEVV